MKHQLKIVSTLILLLTINISFATGVENNPKKSQEQEQAKQRNGANDHAGQLEDQKPNEKVENVAPEVEEEEKETISDTVEDDSVSKYNFIFYFLYKFKYEAEA